MTQICSMVASLQVLLYTCMLLKAAKPHLLNPLRYAFFLRRQSPTRHRLKVRRVSVKALRGKAPTGLHCELDLNAAAVVSVKTAIDLGLRNGQWHRVIFWGEDSARKIEFKSSLANIRGRWIQVVSCPGVEDKLCLVSPVLYHNLQRGGRDQGVIVDFVDGYRVTPSEDIKKVLALWSEVQGAGADRAQETVTPSLPNTAAEVHVKVIESAQYKYGSELEALLRDYFRIPKIVALGDTLMLSLPSHVAHEFTPSTAIVPPKTIYVKVVKVIGRSGLETTQCLQVAVSKTNLYLAGTTQSSFPPYTEDFDRRGDIDVPPILKETYLRLRNIMQMILRDKDERTEVTNGVKKGTSNPGTPRNIGRKQRNKSSTTSTPDAELSSPNTIKSVSVLLLGSPGQGSEQVVKLAASSVGLGSVWVNCWQLKGDTSGATEARLHQTFVRASAYGPCVLVLQDIHSLAKVRKELLFVSRIYIFLFYNLKLDLKISFIMS